MILGAEEAIPCDKLPAAAGSRPFAPSIEGPAQVKNRFMSLDDAKALAGASRPGSRLLVIGAGLIGPKCVKGIRGWVRWRWPIWPAIILPSVLDEEGAAPLQRQIGGRGVRFLPAAGGAAFEGSTARLESGGIVDFDLLATGVQPNTVLIETAGAWPARGCTSLPDIYAAGDCTESRDSATDEDRVLALLSAAYMQGEGAGIHMAAGGGHPYGKPSP